MNSPRQDGPPRILFLANSPNDPGLRSWTAETRSASIPTEEAFLAQPWDLLGKIKRLRQTPSDTLTHAFGPVCVSLASLILPQSAPLAATGWHPFDGSWSETSWNRWVSQRIDAHLEEPSPGHPARPVGAGEHDLWFFGDWTAHSGAQQLLWAFTMIAMAGWRVRLRLFGQGIWEETLKHFARLASFAEQIDFLPCDPAVLRTLAPPQLVFCPNRANLPHWLSPALSGIPLVTSGQPPLTQSGDTDSAAGSAPTQHFIDWKPAELARLTMELLGPRLRPSPGPQETPLAVPIWTRIDCYRLAWAQALANRP